MVQRDPQTARRKQTAKSHVPTPTQCGNPITQHSTQHPQPAPPQTPEGVSTFPYRIALGNRFSRRILPSPQSLRPTAVRLPPRCNSDRGFIQFSHPHSGPLLPPGRTTTTLPVWTNALMDCPSQVGRPTMLTVCLFRLVHGQSLLSSGPNCGPSSKSAATRSAPNTRPSQARPQMTNTHTRENRIQSNSAWSILV